MKFGCGEEGGPRYSAINAGEALEGTSGNRANGGADIVVPLIDLSGEGRKLNKVARVELLLGSDIQRETLRFILALNAGCPFPSSRIPLVIST